MSAMSGTRWSIGPTGAGKSVLLALMALQFRRYPGAQVFAFDFGGSIRAATLAMGGDWHDLGGGADAKRRLCRVALQPLAGIDQVPERAWAADWIVAILMREGIADHAGGEGAPLDGPDLACQRARRRAHDHRARRPAAVERAQASAAAVSALAAPTGRLLDAESERSRRARRSQAFETEGLIGTGARTRRPVLSVSSHRGPARRAPDAADRRRGLAGARRRRLRQRSCVEWLKTLRKKNASVVFATQSLSDVDRSAIAPAIIESCPTRLFLPNERAIEPQITAIYRRFGLNDRQIEILARATPKRDYYCQSRRGNRLFELGLSDVALAFCATSSKTDQAAIARTLAEHGRDGFLAAWLRQRGVAWAADVIPDLTNLEDKP